MAKVRIKEVSIEPERLDGLRSEAFIDMQNWGLHKWCVACIRHGFGDSLEGVINSFGEPGGMLEWLEEKERYEDARWFVNEINIIKDNLG